MSILARFSQESAIELADSITKLANSTTDSLIIGRPSVLNMFNILNPPELAYSSRLTPIVIFMDALSQ